MQAKPEQIQILLELSKIDRQALSSQKRLEDLPQRGQILAARKKREGILEKRESVEKMRKAAEGELKKITDEDAMLGEKQNQVQATIDSCRGDFRSVEAHTKELNGIAKRRSALEEQLDEVDGRLSKIKLVEDQIEALMASVDAEEAAAVASFKQEGGQLKAAVEAATALHNQKIALLPDELVTAYQKASKRGAGVALGMLEKTQCSVCRSQIDEAHLIALRTQAPIGQCPSCKRLLIISASE